MTIRDFKDVVSSDVILFEPDLNHPPENVVYMLCNKIGDILYIGKSTNYGLPNRCICHAKRFEFESVYVISFDDSEECYKVEQGLILLVNPPVNKQYIPYLEFVQSAIDYLGLDYPVEIPEYLNKCYVSETSGAYLIDVEYKEGPISSLNEEVGDKIRHAIIDARKQDGTRYTQVEVADAVGLSKDHLNKVLRGVKEISLEKLAEIAQLFGCAFRIDVGGVSVVVNDGCEKEY